MNTLSELRNLASELGMELIYMVGRSRTEFEKVTTDNFSKKKHIGLLRDGELFHAPIGLMAMIAKLTRAVSRKKKATHIKRTKKLYGVESE